MALIRWQPEKRNIGDQAGREFSKNRQGDKNVSVSWEPVADMVETDEGFQITMELPGVPKGDVKLNIIENMLTIKGEKKNEFQVPEKNFYRIERHFGNFQRTFHLSDKVDVNKIQATYKDGILTISLGKKEETKPREISIQVK